MWSSSTGTGAVLLASSSLSPSPGTQVSRSRNLSVDLYGFREAVHGDLLLHSQANGDLFPEDVLCLNLVLRYLFGLS